MRRGEVYLVRFGPAVGSEVVKDRPCVVVSPDEMNAKAATFIGVPLTTKYRPYPSRIRCEVRDKVGYAMLDQVQVLSPQRIISQITQLHQSELERVLDRLAEMFAL
ncbi:MAG TPA: type II toxin-antitoxin system PemK/MazF family toxin [Candidatus Saccharimonadia bacterium]|nr:type II toxin-antitoxin system PemK/MazF family toxin [Candidatus Saccharimonadia bacterium]